MPVLEAVGTAVPGEPVPQRAVKAKAEEVLSQLAPDLVKHLSVFDSTGIATRHFVRPIDWYLESRGWRGVNEIYRDEGLALLEAATRDALEAAGGLPPESIDGIVLVSTTGLSTPSLDARLVNRMGLRSDVQRVPVWGLGCAGGVAGLNLAADLARAHPDRRYLLLSLEVCSLAFHLTDMSVRAFVATTLFSDGAAAALVRGDKVQGGSRAPAPLGRLRKGASHEWRDSEDVMGWTVEDEGLFVVFSRKIPDIVGAQLAPVVQSYLKRERDGRAPDRHVFHPGGTKVLGAYEDALGLPPEAFASARDTLRRYGNMSSPTVLFALREDLRARGPLAPGETALLAALGPGFAAELALLEG
jgi:alkylresorcinol/alkylpyrone synthase